MQKKTSNIWVSISLSLLCIVVGIIAGRIQLQNERLPIYVERLVPVGVLLLVSFLLFIKKRENAKLKDASK